MTIDKRTEDLIIEVPSLGKVIAPAEAGGCEPFRTIEFLGVGQPSIGIHAGRTTGSGVASECNDPTSIDPNAACSIGNRSCQYLYIRIECVHIEWTVLPTAEVWIPGLYGDKNQGLLIEESLCLQ